MGNGSQNTNNSTRKELYRLNALTTLIFYLSILFFIIGFNFTDSVIGNWYQQFLPNIGSRSITDVFFLDSLTGWCVTNNQNQDSAYVLKTSNGGDNWTIQYRKIIGSGFSGYFRVFFLNQSTGYTCSVTGFDKTTNGGINWTPILTADTYVDMGILNVDTIWLVSSNSLTGGVFRTTNGGVSWQQQLSLGSQNPSHIYFYNARIGFAATGAGLYKTTNSGVNWFSTPGGFFFNMYFSDSLTGWKCHQLMEKTTDGGATWINLPLPSGGNFVLNYMLDFSNVVKDTIWGAGPVSTSGRALIYKSVDGGLNFGYQVIDPSINIFQFLHSKFTDKLKGWEYSGSTGVHTTTGGDTITYVSAINQISTEIPKEFKLYQNYPNPFNPKTIIRYDVKRQASNVKLIIYDIEGREISALVNQKQNAGTYQADFTGSDLSSGVYFYQLTISSEQSAEVYRETRKMILIK